MMENKLPSNSNNFNCFRKKYKFKIFLKELAGVFNCLQAGLTLDYVCMFSKANYIISTPLPNKWKLIQCMLPCLACW